MQKIQYLMSHSKFSKITVGDPSRAKTIAQYLDRRPQTAPMDLLDSTSDSSSGDKVVPGPLFTLLSERGFLTITGTYNGVPISVVAIGMGAPNMDFFIRECREILEGEMIIIRYNSPAPREQYSMTSYSFFISTPFL